MLADMKNSRIFAPTLLCLFVWVFRALSSDKGERVFLFWQIYIAIISYICAFVKNQPYILFIL
jgi:hypothetical protein